ncbi:MAG: DUF533 domain-containing protein [Rhodobacteraceae bacterium]|jgi:uncharacterized membrane protein YebE (DUF533 family)|nr:tellurite resistance TerB family protein [Alphaproteobacteria bacterium]MBT8473845.1 tellurite resistance TerB family protein [Alphaproteobacteria bacterium]NNF72628.1 DUF533 domain-containing protein [Paracoccaceae bacterium]NNK67358.1 DUF533 domain-containing protein [Paracoccaceae bacterium]
MSFVKTLATLAVGFAASKGYDKFKSAGGMAGMQEAMKSNPAMAGMADQMGAMMEKFGIPGGAEGLQGMMGQMTGGAGAAGDNAAAGLGGLMAALGGAAATGAEQSAGMMDALLGNTSATDTMEENAKLTIRAMIQAAKADGEIDAGEREKILEMLGDIDAEERAFVEAEMAAPVDIMGLANDTSDAMKAQIYAMSVSTVRVDTGQEVSYLNGLADALGLDDATRARIHASMGLG